LLLKIAKEGLKVIKKKRKIFSESDYDEAISVMNMLINMLKMAEKMGLDIEVLE